MENQEPCQDPENADWNIDQEDRSPSETCQVELNEKATHDVSGDRAYSADSGEKPER
jgi:hypothetical protein